MCYWHAEAVKCGVCAIGAFDLDRTHELLSIDYEDEILVYIATVGKIKYKSIIILSSQQSSIEDI